MTKIEKQNAKLMRSAGFKKVGKPINIGLSLITWGRGALRISTGSDEKMSLNNLVDCIIDQTLYWNDRYCSIKRQSFPTSNKVDKK